jgi:tRNA A-37 threonylcarbamoyl transferase component Bud32
MSDFIAAEDRALLEQHGLCSFEALWELQLDAVDAPNTGRGGWSAVCRLELDGRGYYLKRQSNHRTRSLRHPLGEPTFAREFRNIQHYGALGVPALQAAFYAQRRLAGERRAILLTRALDGWQDLAAYLAQWPALDSLQHQAIVRACGELARLLHGAGLRHGCFYPRHIFLRPQGEDFIACLIDLEKTRRLRGWRNGVTDLEPLFRRSSEVWGDAERRQFLQAYLQDAAAVPEWLAHLDQRGRSKASRP